MRGTAQQHEVAVMQRYAPDLTKDPVHVWLNRLYYVPLIICGLLLFALGGWTFLLWGVFLRVALGLHFTWLVNSATHLWGTRRFATDDDSKNSLWVALLTFGEGWHNNHHAYPRAARHGLAWYELDLNWWGIRTLKFLGLAHDITLITPAQISESEEVKVLRRAA
jgi:stearoyl-CoA desaturase (delta-9 desaturase)